MSLSCWSVLKRRPFVAFAATCITTLGITSAAPAIPAASASSSATSGSVTWWSWTPTDNAIANAEIAAFNKQFPNIKVTFKLITITNWVAALRPALVSGDGPDIFSIQPVSQVQQFNSFAQDLRPAIVSALGKNWQTKVASSGVGGLTYNGKLIALSVGSVYAGTLWINVDLFNKYGVKAPKTLAQWVQDCKIFKSHGQGCFVQGASQEGFNQDTLQSIADSVKPGVWTKASLGQAKWNDPVIVKAFSIWKQLFTDGIMQPGALGYQQYPDGNNAFLTGKYAMVMMGTWYMANVTTAGMTSALQAAGVTSPKPFPILPIQFPDVAGMGNKSAIYGDSDFGLSLYTHAKNAAAATTFIKWLATNPVGQQAVANQLDDLPALRSIQPNFSAIKLVNPGLQTTPIKQLISQVTSSNEPRESLLSAAVQNAIQVAAQSVATGNASPQAAANTLQSAAVASGEKFK
jgi:raffinose/stachyose/melibiose transport system substrate-binding protein